MTVMVEKYDDDEVVVGSGNETLGAVSQLGKVPVDFDNEPEVPLGDAKYELLLELSGRGTGNDRLGADIVVVLDVSGSMGGNKLKEMKRAMQFVIRKLSPSDRLSIITFSTDSERICNLRQMTPEAQEKVDFLVQNLKAAGNTNITSGLQRALKVLDDRTHTDRRSSGIMLMSDGIQSEEFGDPTEISVDRYSVFTFGFGTGAEYDSKVLNDIAYESKGGTFSLADPGKLSEVFAQCLGGLLSVLVQDVELVVKPLTDKVSKKDIITTKINKVYAGNYTPRTDPETGSVTVPFGNLYQKERRTVLVDLFLPAVLGDEDDIQIDALEISCSYRSDGGGVAWTNPEKFSVNRNSTPSIEQKDATKAEIKRVATIELMTEARDLADQNNMEEALNKVVKARNSLEDLDIKRPNSVIETLKYELCEMVKFMQTEETYKNKGRSFTYCSKTSHERQRFASRGGGEKMRCYATPRMDKYLEQAKSFEKDPTQELPTAADDGKQELAADPLAAITPSLDHYLRIAINALKEIQKIINQKP